MGEELVRVGTADVRAVEAEGVSGRRYRADKGFYEMTPRDAAAMKAVGGFTPTIGGTSIGRPGGYTCARGHRNFFKDCGRCKAIDRREAEERLIAMAPPWPRDIDDDPEEY